ncbi:MAG: response regulator [Ginsengibacter sp.]
MKKILLIDDSKDLRENTAEILELANYKVFTAENGKAGVELALKEDPDLIICDIMMPKLDGYGVLYLLQKNPSSRNKPFIFLSAKIEHKDLRKAMESGADDYITKPFTGIELLSAVESRLKKMDLIEKQFKGDMQELQQLQQLQELIRVTSGDALKDLTDGSNINYYKKKQKIYSEGNRPISLYYVKEGKVKTFKTNNIGKDLVIGLYNKNEFFGHIALLEQTNYQETAIAMEDTELAEIPKEDFELLINNNHEVTHKFIQLLTKNISEKEEQLLGMAYNSLRKKVANALITLNRKYNTGKEEKFRIDITRESLASIAGTATESLIRTLGDFKNENLISIKESVITILNAKKLENLLN